MSNPNLDQSSLFLLVQQLQQEVQNQRVEIQSLRSDLDASRASVHQLELQLRSATPPSRSRLPDPPRFDGKPLTLRTWLPSIRAKLRSDQLSGADAFDYQASVLHLRHQAEENNTWDVEDIFSFFQRLCHNPREQQEAIQRFSLVRQRDEESLIAYLARFERLAYESGASTWPDTSRISVLHRGLRSSLRQSLEESNDSLFTIPAAKRITTKKASIHLQWAPGHNDVKGNEKADTLAKEAAKERPTTSTTASLAYLGTEINKIQKTEQLMEYKRYTDRPTKNRSSYSRIFKLNTHTTIKVPKGTPREISSAFYSLKLGHGYFNSYLKRFNKRDCNLCICYKPQTPQHLLLDCKQYKTHRNTLKESIPHRPITLPLLLQTKTGIKATLAFIASTRIGTRKWHLGQTTEQTDTV
ncbi:Retrotrans-gag domain containing protein [Pyrenophora tritici-repentis]|uniref:Retrotrans-gag domain containing protein n=1 Tax=Pyrenophora tritici-repentis TaxID=45151 RepID=A0A834RJI9_9PLEO|nr:Retrotrans-gag domain containing protein [Pyrenophora tritici-repentis]